MNFIRVEDCNFEPYRSIIKTSGWTGYFYLLYFFRCLFGDVANEKWRDGLLGESPLRHRQRRSFNESFHNGREARLEEYDCALQFKRYIPSSYEQEWYDNVKERETNLEEVKLDVDHDWRRDCELSTSRWESDGIDWWDVLGASC